MFMTRFIIKRFTHVNVNYIFFDSEGDFADNARALYEYSLKNDKNEIYRIFWKVKRKSN